MTTNLLLTAFSPSGILEEVISTCWHEWRFFWITTVFDIFHMFSAESNQTFPKIGIRDTSNVAYFATMMQVEFNTDDQVHVLRIWCHRISPGLLLGQQNKTLYRISRFHIQHPLLTFLYKGNKQKFKVKKCVWVIEKFEACWTIIHFPRYRFLRTILYAVATFLNSYLKNYCRAVVMILNSIITY